MVRKERPEVGRTAEWVERTLSKVDPGNHATERGVGTTAFGREGSVTAHTSATGGMIGSEGIGTIEWWDEYFTQEMEDQEDPGDKSEGTC